MFCMHTLLLTSYSHDWFRSGLSGDGQGFLVMVLTLQEDSVKQVSFWLYTFLVAVGRVTLICKQSHCVAYIVFGLGMALP